MIERQNENFILMLVSLACVGLTAESILMGWEFWVPPLVIIGTVLLWVMNITSKPDYGTRKVGYLIYAMLVAFFHGVHETSFYDVAIVITMIMLAYSIFDHIYMINLIMVEYVIIMGIQLILANNNPEIIIDKLLISRAILHFLAVLFVFFCCKKTINDRIENRDKNKKKDEIIDNYDADMEDFLSNISHELRTPVNVVNGMSDLMIKRNVGQEVYAVKNAGIRLAYQIEDILDYTECKRNKVLLEEDEYMSTSLINDVVTSFRMLDNSNNLELVVDLAPSVPTKMKGDIKKLHKIFRHLMENAVKFTKRGGILVRMYSEKTEYGVNLIIEMNDTGIGMDRRALESISEGMFQVNKKRNRSSGGIGLGLYIVYGFTHRLGGFVKIESEKNTGTTVRVTIPQKVIDEVPCLAVSASSDGDILFHVRADKYFVPKVREFYRTMATNLATGIHVPLYSAETIGDIERLKEKLNVKYIFMGQEEYVENSEYFDELSKGDLVVAVSAYAGFKVNAGSQVMTMPKPLYAYPIIKILNEGKNAKNIEFSDNTVRPVFRGVKALVVDDEPMNLVVATSIFSDYEMIIDTAGSGKEAIKKFKDNEYDVVFMDHMMPEMDGVEAMKMLKRLSQDTYGKDIPIIVLTANVVSGAKEMFKNEGFDGFISKPIHIAEFERAMLQVLPGKNTVKGGKEA